MEPEPDTTAGYKWFNYAACKDMSEKLGEDLFFYLGSSLETGSGKYGRRRNQARNYYEAALKICKTCPVRASCLVDCFEHETSNHLRAGVWGGTVPETRNDMSAYQPEVLEAIRPLAELERFKIMKGIKP